MSDAKYLEKKIAEAKTKPGPRDGRVTRQGYTYTSGAPIGTVIRLEGETRWRRLWLWQTSNMGTCFIKSKGECLIVRSYDIPHIKDGCARAS